MKYLNDDLNKGLYALSKVDRRLTLSFGIVILLLMTTVLVVNGVYLKGVMDRDEQKLSTLFTQVLATSVSRVSFSGKYHAQLLLEDTQKEYPDIRSLLITDNEGRILASSIKEKIDTMLKGLSGEIAREVLVKNMTSQTRHTSYADEPVIEITLPYRGGFDHSVQGVVQVGISELKKGQEIRKGIILISAVVILLLVVGILIVRKISRHFGDPIQRLASDMSGTLHAIPDLLFELDMEGRYLQVMANKEELLADTRERLLGRTVKEVLPEEAATAVSSALEQAYKEGESHGLQFSLELPNGTFWFELSAARKDSNSTGLVSFIVISRDITDRKKNEEELHLYANIYQKSFESIMVTDHNNIIIATNPALTKLTGYTFEELEGKDPHFISSDKTPKDTYVSMWDALNNKGLWQGELWDRRKDGLIYPKWTIITAMHDINGNVTNYIATFTDITERKATEEHIHHLAHHDTLTGLYNRFSLEDRLGQAITQAQRDSENLAVIFIDMDHFKSINDTLGHHVGDALLIEIGERLLRSVRKSDIVSRLGGDEFVVVLTNVDDLIGLTNMLIKIIKQLSELYVIGDQELHSTPSIGVSIYPEDGADSEMLMKNADIAMYHAKEQGRNNFQFFTAEMNATVTQRLNLENDLRVALDQQQFELYYQPKIDTCNGKVIGVEALVRWNHPERGLVPPDEFIPVTEESGMIIELGDWVLDQACYQLSLWKQQGFMLKMAVNLSFKQLGDSDFLNRLRDIVEKHNIDEGELELEITETAAMSNAEHAIKQMKAIRIAGVDLSIDDFGTGYSSLSYLKLFPIQSLKLDRTFVRDIEESEDDASICITTISLAHNLGLKIVAEGVETEAQRAFLSLHQCDILQGYLFSRPLPVYEITEYLRLKIA